MEYYLAVDIGASSGRHILGSYTESESGQKFQLEEIYRFDNELEKTERGLVWNIDRLVCEVKAGIKKCNELGVVPKSIAIDTWGVDYLLLDSNKKPIYPAYSYRNSRTEGVVAEVENIIPFEELYKKTGIQKQNFNTIYQLYCDKKEGRLEKAKYFLMIPEYLSYCLTGAIKNEYTNATTTGMVNTSTKSWDKDIMQKLGYPERIFSPLCVSGEEYGCFNEEMAEYAGFDSKVIACPSHDTASAVLASPLKENGLYISSGTWSLMGTELENPILTKEAMLANFTNEGGINYRYRFLKNYMGMWLLQSIRKDLDKKYTYDELMQMAMECEKITYIDVNSPELTSPDNMIEAVKKVAGNPDLTIPEILNCIYHSLAKSYKIALEKIEDLTGKKIDSINIVGGGCKQIYLNRLTAEYTGKKVYSGPHEATALGNIFSQIMADKSNLDLQKVRSIIRECYCTEEL